VIVKTGFTAQSPNVRFSPARPSFSGHPFGLKKSHRPEIPAFAPLPFYGRFGSGVLALFVLFQSSRCGLRQLSCEPFSPPPQSKFKGYFESLRVAGSPRSAPNPALRPNIVVFPPKSHRFRILNLPCLLCQRIRSFDPPPDTRFVRLSSPLLRH